MLAKRIIPCLDVTAGRVVKGVHFVNLRDAGDPVELAARYNPQGADELVFLDITASSDARDIMAGVVARTARKVFIPLAVGGGIRSVADARRILLSGADKVSVNTAAVRRPELITELCPRIRRASRGAGHRRPTPRTGPRRLARLTPAAAAIPKRSTLSNGRPAARRSAPAKSCSLPWTPMACRKASIAALTARRLARHPHPGDRHRAARASPSISSACSPRAPPMRPWRPPSSTTAPTPCTS